MMKLFHAPPSPFARKVRIVLTEKGLQDRTEFVVVNPWEEPEALTAQNPISQVPALVLDDASVLFDSPVICAYLDSLAPEPRLIPQGEPQWPVRRAEAAADALMETVVKLRQEALRPEAERSKAHTERWRRSAVRALEALEAEAPADRFDLGEIATVVALDYVDFRAPDLDWRQGRPNLTSRWARLQGRPSFAATRPG